MAANQKRKRTPPLTPEQALEQIKKAGAAIDRGHAASLDMMGELALARQVRLTREIKRLAKRHGHVSPEADAAAERAKRNTTFAKSLAFEYGRVSIRPPAVDPEAGIVHGRVLTDDGKPVAGAIVSARGADGEVLTETRSEKSGAYVLKIPPTDKGKVRLEATRHGSKQPVDFGTVPVTKGRRTPRELVFRREDSATGPRPKPTPWPEPEPGPTPAPEERLKVKVPKLAGMTIDEAVVALTNAGLRMERTDKVPPRARVTAQKPEAGTEVEAGRIVTLQFKEG